MNTLSLQARLGIVALVLLLLGGLFGAGWWMGADAWKDKHDLLVQSIAQAKEAAVAQAKRDWDITLQGQKALNSDLQAQLDVANSRKPEVQVITKTVTRYVSAKADAACPVPAGFVWVYNSTLGLPESAALARRAPGDADAPTGLALSGVADVAVNNNVECARRGEIIESWQKWYLRNREVFERMRLVGPATGLAP